MDSKGNQQNEKTVYEWEKIFSNDMTNKGLIGEGNGNPLQYFTWRIPIDRGSWPSIVHGVAKSRIQLSN